MYSGYVSYMRSNVCGMYRQNSNIMECGDFIRHGYNHKTFKQHIFPMQQNSKYPNDPLSCILVWSQLINIQGREPCSDNYVSKQKKEKKKKKEEQILQWAILAFFFFVGTLDGNAYHLHESSCVQLLQVDIELVPKWYQFWPYVQPQSIM